MKRLKPTDRLETKRDNRIRDNQYAARQQELKRQRNKRYQDKFRGKTVKPKVNTIHPKLDNWFKDKFGGT